jgi:hypothetical protein
VFSVDLFPKARIQINWLYFGFWSNIYWYIYPTYFSKCRLQITINSSAVNCNDNYYLLDFFKKGSPIKCSSRIHSISNPRLVVLGHTAVIVFAIGPTVRGFKDDGFIRAIKFCSTASFEGEVKPLASCRKTLRHVTDPCGVLQRYFADKIKGLFREVSSCFATMCLYWHFPESSVGWIRKD